MLFLPFRLKYAYRKPVYATLAILLLVLGAYVLQMAGVAQARRWGLMTGQGQVERLVTHAFLHGGLLHLIANVCCFLVFAQVVNAAVGSGLFLAACALSCFSSAALELWLDPRLGTLPGLGLSGVIAGLVVIGSLWIPKVKVTFFFWFILMFGFVDFPVWSVAGTWVITDLYRVSFTDWKEQGTAYWGHVGGFAGGWIAYLVLRRFRVVELRGFLVAPYRSKRRLPGLRKLRARKVEGTGTPEEGAPPGATCLRCGFTMLLKEPPGDKALRCPVCGQQSGAAPPDDTGLRRRKIACGAVLGVLALALFGACVLLMSRERGA